MKTLKDFRFTISDMANVFDPDAVWIEIYKPDRSFTIEGDLIEGYIPDNKVLEQDKICLRFTWLMRDFIDVEIYSRGRMAWYQLDSTQFNKIRNFIAEIN